MSQEIVRGNCKYILNQDSLEVYVNRDGEWRLRDTVTGPKAHELFKSLSTPEPPPACGEWVR
jgi:hypothetical protein